MAVAGVDSEVRERPDRPALRLVVGPDERTIGDLVLAAQSDDRAAFEEIVKRTHRSTYTLALRLTDDAQDAKDVAQDTYLRMYRSINAFRFDAQFSTWLYRITANCASDHLSRRRRNRHDPLDERIDHESDPGTGPEACAEGASLAGEIDLIVRGLAPKLRAVVVLRDIYDLAHVDIAEELSTSVSAVRVRLHRARRQIRAQLFDAGFGPETRQ